jgi:cytochrome b pre-mRNA-processing protein 3
MLGFLFPRLTPAPERGEAMFAMVTAGARERHWYLDGQVPDTIDGRFRMMATLCALLIVRLEQAGEQGETASVALTERFIEVMESEHRELGLGDPKLGRTVRKLVGSLARRVEIWRSAVGNQASWNAAARESVYGSDVSSEALAHTAGRLREIWAGLQGADVGSIAAGGAP